MPVQKIRKVDEKKKLKHKAIVRAAIEIFAEKGFHNTKIKEIAKMANVADGTVYLYFSTKDDLFIKAFDELISEKLLIMKELINKEDTYFEQLTKFFDYHVKLFTDEPYIARFLSIELRQSTEFYKKYPDYQPIKRYLSFLQEIIEKAIAEGSIRDVDPVTLSYIMFGTMDFVLTEWSTKDQPFALGDILQKVKDILRYGYLSEN
ncbi:MAG: hypothetical protein B1H06_04750 [Candidatus Cloacimonas sp. 4484_143]|nr:MAG: hypothetical protein B1H06_04750 [Candidatus Cloacimonas sp. 4484_143]RLC50115.1 MAG: hypothetical protein DRH79_08080 [Candidatus Cloacimonadota bacterium]RLC53342.1 MAG: hypothetical protein DRI23_00560 [Candidatus Cloacimonadota bacterium]